MSVKEKESKNAIYITTTLPYVNASPHVGFALEIVQADAFARFMRILGKEVFFNTGTDEHGQKIEEAAKKAGVNPQEYVDKYANEFKTLKDALNLSVDKFIRTTDLGHIKAAQEMWQRAMAKGDIYKKKYKGLYCVGCEAFLSPADLNEKGECPNHPGKKPEEIEEENYFFKLSNYKDALIEYLSDGKTVIPDWRRKEALQTLDSLEDISISRSKERFSWGIDVPKDESQVMYVWFDALVNYISTLGFPADGGDFYKYWLNGYTVQFAGKDQVKFQSVIWQAMLMSAEVKNTNTVFYHGFINSGGQKMSKSLGNVISPYDMVEKYGTDATRYILLRHAHNTKDSDITWEKMNEWYTANLVNGLGNLTARIMKMAETYLDQAVYIEENKTDDTVKEFVNNFQFNEAMDYIWEYVAQLDQAITEKEPFKVIKSDKEAGQKIITDLVRGLDEIVGYLEPFMPQSAEIIKQAIKENKKPNNLFKRL